MATRRGRPIDVNVEVRRGGRFQGSPRRTGESVNRAGLIERVARLASIRVVAALVDLDLIALIHRELPVVRRIAAAKRREPDEHSGIVGDVGGAPIDAQHEILELLLREPDDVTDGVLSSGLH